MDISIPDISLYQCFHNNLKKYKEKNAIDYYGTKITYEDLDNKVNECAKAFLYYGIRNNDVVTICMPNTPEGVIAFLALNKIGAISNMIHPLDILCNELNITHKLIRPRTPRHNGKVERSHRNDQQRFYSYLSFYSFDDLLIQMKAYLKRSNNIPMQVLNWLTPLQKREQLKKQC